MPVENIGIEIEEQVKIHQQLDDLLEDYNLDFTVRYDNLRRMQLDVIQKYGRDGMAVVLDYQTRIYIDAQLKRSYEIMHYSEVPTHCPWYDLRFLPIDKVIRTVWKTYPIEFSTKLEENCKDLFVVFAERKWFLAYAYQARDYRGVESCNFLAGREPNRLARLSDALIDQAWKMPKDLKTLYQIHGNFGDITAAIRNDNTFCISSVEKLETSLIFLEEYVEKWELDYSFYSLLTFCEDGAGNSQNFHKAMPENGSYMTVDWDHETKEISGASTLADFIDFQFGGKLEGRW